jgi:aromatic-amino-acid transaminase
MGSGKAAGMGVGRSKESSALKFWAPARNGAIATGTADADHKRPQNPTGYRTHRANAPPQTSIPASSLAATIMSLFAKVALAPRDPILGLNEQFIADTNPNKVNLGVGVYFDANGKLPVLQCVQVAEKEMAVTPKPRGYLPIDGIAAYDKAVQQLVFGADSPALAQSRVATVQAVGGTGGLKVGADFLKRLNPQAKVLISDPSWENHRALFSNAGFEVETYPYYDAQARGVRFADMLACLQAAAPGTVVVLHACCHNPTGYDLTPAQWAEVVEVMQAGALVPFLDMAYQGFGDGIAEDGAAVQQFLNSGLRFFVATSFSKSFSLYGERVGALSVVCADKEENTRVLSQLKVVIRSNYSNPPTHGAQVVTTVLSAPELRALWEEELAGMRERIRQMRAALVQGLQAAGVKQDMSFILRQKGMFSYSGLNAEQMQRLRAEFGVYGVDSGRICVAALNEQNLKQVASAMATVM